MFVMMLKPVIVSVCPYSFPLVMLNDASQKVLVSALVMRPVGFLNWIVGTRACTFTILFSLVRSHTLILGCLCYRYFPIKDARRTVLFTAEITSISMEIYLSYAFSVALSDECLRRARYIGNLEIPDTYSTT